MYETDVEPAAFSLLPISAWRRAAMLVERVKSMREANGAWQVRTNGQGDVERGRQRLEEWRAQEPFSRSALFQERLAQAGLTEAEFVNLLSEPTEAAPALCELCERYGDLTVADGEPPAWVQEINQALTAPVQCDLPPFPEMLRDKPACGLLGLIRPLMGRAVAQLRNQVRKLTTPSGQRPFVMETIDEILFGPLPEHLLAMLLRTLTLELHVARLQGRLHGETSEERFESFVRLSEQPEYAMEFFREYPVLARQIVNCLDHWLSASLEFLERWCADWPAIRSSFSPGADPGPLVGIQADSGDSHRGGRSVLIARCRSGFQVVYKPKSLAVDQHFQELLGWLNERGASPAFRQLKILDRGSYGWEEFVAAASCSSAAEVKRFYLRQGGYLALLYALAAADFHYENLIAVGEHPVLIDLEVLLQPHMLDAAAEPADILAGHSAYGETVLGAMLLPLRIWPESQADSVDLSGIGAEAGQQLPWQFPSWNGTGTDEMQFTRRKDTIESSDHRPNLNGAAVDPLDHVTAMETGLRQVYQLLEKHRQELLSPGGLLERFQEDEVRILYRATSNYRQYLDEGSHPDVLRDALDRDRLFDRLWEEVKTTPRMARLIPAEIADLWRGDIPYFSTRPGSHDVWGSDGQCFADELRRSGMEEVRRRLDQLGEKDLARQLWYLRASIATLMSENEGGTPSGYHLVENGPAADRERLLAASRAVADWITEQAVRGAAGDVSWIGLTLVRDEHYSLLPLGTDLYDGVPGVALFLAYVGKVSGEERYTDVARACLKTMWRRLGPDKRHKTVDGIGGFSGWGGILYALAHLGTLWNEPEIFAAAGEYVSGLPSLIEQDKYFDIGSGSAGCIAGLLCLHRCAPSGPTLAAAVQCGDHLLARARPMANGVGWDWPWPSRGPLIGYPHGAAGIALALLQLRAQTGDERFRAAARQAIAYERSVFSTEAGNWPDLRLFGVSPGQAAETPLRYSTSWCHGAPGIGLARLRSLAYLDDALLRGEIDTAVRTTWAKGFGLNHILCHGDLGNLELLLEVARQFPEARGEPGCVSPRRGAAAPPLPAEIERLAAGILNSIEQDGWLCGNPTGLVSPGLMTGIAGIGYQLLRLAEPDKVPSVLTLSPPVPAATAYIGVRESAVG